MLYGKMLLLAALVVQVGCASSGPQPSHDYYRELTSEEVYQWISSCLRREVDCPGRAEAWASYRGPKFNSSQRLTILDWNQEQVGGSAAALQVKIKDDGMIYDTTINVDAIAGLGPRGIRRLEIRSIYGGKWAFNEGFADAARSVAIIGGAAAYGAKKLHDSTGDSADRVGSFLLDTGSFCGKGTVEVRSVTYGTTRSLECCGWGNLGSQSYSLPSGEYNLSFAIQTCTGRRYAGQGVRFSVAGKSLTKVKLNLETGYYTVE